MYFFIFLYLKAQKAEDIKGPMSTVHDVVCPQCSQTHENDTVADNFLMEVKWSAVENARGQGSFTVLPNSCYCEMAPAYTDDFCSHSSAFFTLLTDPCTEATWGPQAAHFCFRVS